MSRGARLTAEALNRRDVDAVVRGYRPDYEFHPPHEFVEVVSERPLPRIGIHAGGALYRDGDYYGRAVNLASRVGARAAGGEVLVTRPVVEAAGRHLEFRHIGEVRMKGFDESTELFLASSAEEP